MPAATEDTTAIQDAVAYVIERYREVTEENGAPTPIAPRHIAILFRRFRSFGNDVTRGYVRARVIDIARQFERGASSFRAFVNKLESDAEHGEADEAPIVEEGTEGVRL